MYALMYTLLLLIHNYNQQTMVTLLFHVCGSLSLAAAVSACAEQHTNSHEIYEVQTLGNSLCIGLRTDYSSVHTAGGASDRH